MLLLWPLVSLHSVLPTPTLIYHPICCGFEDGLHVDVSDGSPFSVWSFQILPIDPPSCFQEYSYCRIISTAGFGRKIEMAGFAPATNAPKAHMLLNYTTSR